MNLPVIGCLDGELAFLYLGLIPNHNSHLGFTLETVHHKPKK